MGKESSRFDGGGQRQPRQGMDQEHMGRLHWPARASDFFEDLLAQVAHGAKNGGSFAEMMGPSISN